MNNEDWCKENCPYFPDCGGGICNYALGLLKERPEQKHGHWKAEKDFYDGDDYYICSVCGDTWFLESGNPKDNNMHYCPCCGAKLDEEVKQDDSV